MENLKVYVNGEYYTMVKDRETLGDLIRNDNLFGCRITIEEDRVEVKKTSTLERPKKMNNQKELNYRQSLNKANEQNLNILMLEVADEVDCMNIDFEEKDFEIACSLVEEAYLKSEDLSINQLARALAKLISEDKKALEDITRRKLIDEACYM